MWTVLKYKSNSFNNSYYLVSNSLEVCHAANFDASNHSCKAMCHMSNIFVRVNCLVYTWNWICCIHLLIDCCQLQKCVVSDRVSWIMNLLFIIYHFHSVTIGITPSWSFHCSSFCSSCIFYDNLESNLHICLFIMLDFRSDPTLPLPFRWKLFIYMNKCVL